MVVERRERQVRFRELWSQARAIPFSGRPGGLDRLQLSAATRMIDNAAQRERFMFVGTVSRQALEDTLYPAAYIERMRLNRNGGRTVRRGPGAGSRSLFYRWPCDELLIVPFYDGDREICGFAARDLHAEIGQAFRFYSLAQRSATGKEAGIAMLSAADENKHAELADCLFIFTNVEAGLRLQLKSCQSSELPLPVVIAHGDDRQETSAATWDQVQQRDRILVCSAVDESLLRQAFLAKARIAVVPDAMRRIMGRQRPPDASMLGTTSFEAMQGQVHDYYYWPMALLTSVRKQALSRQTVLQQHLLSLQPEAAVNLLQKVLPDSWERHRFLDECSPYLRSQLARGGGRHILELRAKVGKHIVVERDDAWWVDGTEERICDRIRVIRVLRCVHGGDLVEGNVIVDGEQHSYCLPLKTVERKGLLGALSQSLGERGVSLDYRRGWSRRAFRLATELYRPAEIENADSVGWCNGQYRCPTFGVSASGITTELAAPVIEPRAPGRTLTLPQAIQQRRLHAITLNTPPTQLFWAVARSMITILSMPVLRLQPMGVLLVGEQATTVRDAIAKAFDCGQAKLSIRTTPLPPGAKRRLVRHFWPTVLNVPAKDPRVSRVLGTVQPDFLVAAAPAIDTGKALAAGWWVVNADCAEDISLIESFAADVVISFLPEVLLWQRDLRNDSAGPEQALWSRFRGWFVTKCRGRTAIDASAALIQFPDHMRVGRSSIPTQLDGSVNAVQIHQAASLNGKKESADQVQISSAAEGLCPPHGHEEYPLQVHAVQ